MKGQPDFRGRTDPRGRTNSKARRDHRSQPSAQDIQRAIAGDAEESSGKQTRRKRFIDPNSSFGKTSHVYRFKFGDMKDKAEAILARDEEKQARIHGTWNDGAARRRGPRRMDSEGQDREGPPARGRPRAREGGFAERQERERPWSRAREGGPAERQERERPRGRGWEDGPAERRERSSGRWEGGPADRQGRERHESRASEGGPDFGTRRSRPREDGMRSENTKPDRRREPISIGRATAASQFLFGTAVINSALAARRRKLYRLYVLNSGKRAQEIEDEQNNPQILAKKFGVSITFVNQEQGAMMDKMSGGRPHNGYILEASPLPQLPVTALGAYSSPHSKPTFEVELGRQSKEEEAVNGTDARISYRRGRQRKPFVVLLHEVLDPGNLGAMIRTATFLGASAVAITTSGSASLTPVATKAAAGASEEIPILVVGSDMDFITASQRAGWRFYAAAPPSLHKDPRKTTSAKVEKDDPLREAPCVLVLGSEGRGLPKTLRRAADFEISIPGSSITSVNSLNVSVAGGILCNAFINPSLGRSEKETESERALFSEETAERETRAEGSRGQEQPSEGEPAEEEPDDGEERVF